MTVREKELDFKIKNIPDLIPERSIGVPPERFS